jgi:hypothetical protein
MRYVEGSIYELFCSTCDTKIPLFIFSGDTDMATDGLVSAGSNSENTVAIVEVLSDEYTLNGYAFDKIGKRFSMLFGRDDFHFVQFLRAEDVEIPNTTSFGEFRAHYKPPIAVFSCPCCAGGEMRAVKISEARKFQEAGGQILVGNDLVLRDEAY